MFKTSSNELIRIAKALDKASNAINTLERLGSNKHVFLETKKELQDLSDELKSRYDLESFNEWIDKKDKVKMSTSQ